MAKGDTAFSNNADEHELLEVKKEILRLKSQLKQTEEERDILKKAARYFSISLSLNTAINLKLKRCFGFLRLLVLAITPGCMNPNQAKRLKISGYDSSSVLLMMPVMVSMGYRRITLDLKELGESCGPNRVLKIMMNNSIAAVRGYKKHKSYGRGRPQIVPSNHLNREFVVKTPDILRNSVSQVTDITYIRTWQGWLYLAVVLDLYSRKVIGWSMKPTLAKDIVLDALLMAVWRRKPNESMIIHSIARYTAHGIMPLLNPFLAI